MVFVFGCSAQVAVAISVAIYFVLAAALHHALDAVVGILLSSS